MVRDTLVSQLHLGLSSTWLGTMSLLAKLNEPRARFTDAGGQIIWEVYLVPSYLAKIGQHFRLGMLLYLTYPDVEAGHHHLSSGCDDRDVLTDDPLLHIHHLALDLQGPLYMDTRLYHDPRLSLSLL